MTIAPQNERHARAYGDLNDCAELAGRVIETARAGGRLRLPYRGRMTIHTVMLDSIVRRGIVTEGRAP